MPSTMTLSDNFRLAVVSRGPEWSRRGGGMSGNCCWRSATVAVLAMLLFGCGGGNSDDGDDNTGASPTGRVVRSIFALSPI